MLPNRLNSASRSFGAVAGLLLFLSGSNLCLLTALSGGTMACLSVPSADAAAQSDCPHHAGPAGKLPDRGARTSSCCVTIAPVASPQVGKAEPAPAHLAAVATLAVAPQPIPAASAGPIANESPPPLPDLATRHSGRAPPLL